MSDGFVVQAPLWRGEDQPDGQPMFVIAMSGPMLYVCECGHKILINAQESGVLGVTCPQCGFENPAVAGFRDGYFVPPEHAA